MATTSNYYTEKNTYEPFNEYKIDGDRIIRMVQVEVGRIECDPFINTDKEMNELYRMWKESAKGKWTLDHTVSPLRRSVIQRTDSFSTLIIIVAIFQEKDATFFKLKWY